MDIAALVAFALSSLPAKAVALAMAFSALCSAFVALVPPPKNLRTAWGFFYQGIDWIALNIGHGKTAAKAVAKGEVVPAAQVAVRRGDPHAWED